jgi:hypothetical protein
MRGRYILWVSAVIAALLIAAVVAQIEGMLPTGTVPTLSIPAFLLIEFALVYVFVK